MKEKFRWWLLIEVLCAMGCAVGLLFLVLMQVFTSTLFIFLAVILLIIGGAYVIKILKILMDLDRDDDIHRVGNKLVFEDTYKEPKPWKFSIIAFIIVTTCIILGFWEMQRIVTSKWTEKCAQYNLGEECTDAEICKVSCEKLHKEYYVYKPGRADECWCRVGDSTERIY